jgi:hypothetical protein
MMNNSHFRNIAGHVGPKVWCSLGVHASPYLLEMFVTSKWESMKASHEVVWPCYRCTKQNGTRQYNMHFEVTIKICSI